MNRGGYARWIVVAIVIVMMLSPVVQVAVAHNPYNSGRTEHSTTNNLVPSRGPGISKTGQAVNVNNLYSSEPAPMGIADYGIGPGGSPYDYSTTSFLGRVDIKNLQTYNASLNGTATELTFQLNINYVFYVGSKKYVYWAQNVADFNTSASQSIGFIDNIWNETKGDSSVYNSTLNGNGTVSNSSGTFFYYSFANQSLPGNDIYVTYPLSIEMEINSTTNSKGLPELVFMYNDGHGWQTYDNVIFRFATNVSRIDGFVVDGFQYEPDGYSFYDAELILGGPGDGTQTYDVSSSVSLQLEYFNGHNYQTVTNAYNFGSNTAEGISNVTSTASYYESNGSLFASVVNGPGHLAQIYNRSQIGILNISANGTSGYVLVNSTRYSYVGGSANFTLAPGKYDIKVYSSKNVLMVQRNETIGAGGYYYLSTTRTYKATFISSGIPSGSTWYLNLSNGESFRATSQNYSAYIANGSYTFTASSGGIYQASGSFNVSGSNVTVNVVFIYVPVRTYEVTFQESGLIAGEEWNITLDGSKRSSTNSSIVFVEKNGTYNFTVGSVSGYVSSPSSGEINVSGSNTNERIVFSPEIVVSKYSVTFAESGLVAGLWYVNLTGGLVSYSSNNTIKFMLPNGTYNYSVGSGNPFYVPYPAKGSFSVVGHSLRINVTFSELTLTLEFNETGLPPGSLWSVTVNGTTGYSTSSNVTFLVTPGTYDYQIIPPSGYTSSKLSGTVKAVNSSTVVAVEFTQYEFKVTFNVSGIPSGTPWTITFDGASFTTSYDSVSFTVTDGSYLFSIENVTGYSVQPETGTLIVNGSSLNESIVFSKVVTNGYLTGSVSPADATVIVNGQYFPESNGQFNISLPPGVYEVKVEASGYTTYIANITISPGTATPLQISTLAKSPGSSSSSLLEKIIIAIIVIIIISLVAYATGRRRS